MSGRIAKGSLYYLGIGPRTSTAALATVDFCACGAVKQSNSRGEVKDSKNKLKTKQKKKNNRIPGVWSKIPIHYIRNKTN